MAYLNTYIYYLRKYHHDINHMGGVGGVGGVRGTCMIHYGFKSRPIHSFDDGWFTETCPPPSPMINSATALSNLMNLYT